MHALTCEVLEPQTYAYAAIPTYYEPSKFITAKVFIEFVWHSESSIFYHCIVTELLDNDIYTIQTLQTCLLRTIDRRTGKVQLARPEIPQFALDKQSVLTALQAWQSQYILDIPAPFVSSTEQGFKQIKQDIIAHFKEMLFNIERHE